MRRLTRAAVIVAALGVLGFATSRPMPAPLAAPASPNAFAFGALGDAPYQIFDAPRYSFALKDLGAHELSFVVHVGDILWRPCSDARYQHTLGEFNGLRHPVIYTPGDNEWTDCWERGSGSYQPAERLNRLRQIFFTDPAQSLGGRRIALATQSAQEPYAEFVEHARWRAHDVVIATVHLIGSWNGTRLHAGQAADVLQATARRTAAAAAWLHETFAEALDTSAAAVVVAFHADPNFDRPAGHESRQSFEPFLAALEEEAERFPRPVLVIHGDSHDYAVDRPVIRRTTGMRLDHVTRLVVPGSPNVGWVRIVVNRAPAVSFTFDPRVVSRWKYW